ncbi:hypothetical protein K8R14_05335, partial [bacterium]|nr:hypothetical protein [bacterium]
FALFHYHPLIKFEDSKKLANHQKPACFMTRCYKLGVNNLVNLVERFHEKLKTFFKEGITYCS